MRRKRTYTKREAESQLQQTNSKGVWSRPKKMTGNGRGTDVGEVRAKKSHLSPPGRGGQPTQQLHPPDWGTIVDQG